MSVLVTGGAGFVGLNLVEALLARGEAVVVFDRSAPPPAFRAAVARRPGRLVTVEGDVRDREALARAFDDHGVDRVFHGAAITAGPARERQAPADVLDVNLMGTLAVLEAARDRGVRRFLYPSSLTVYGESLYAREVVDEETTPPVPEGLYAITKYAGERLALRFGALWGLDVVAARIGSVFGPWEADSGARDLLSPFWQVAAAAAAGRPVTLPRAPLRRELIYSRDLADALVLLLFAERRRFDLYNVAVKADWSDALLRWCRLVAETVPGFVWRVAEADEAATITYHDERPRGRQAVERLARDLGFVPRFDRDGSLADYARWLAAARGAVEPTPGVRDRAPTSSRPSG
ncbi:MAG TPA: NAD(P)-dependent oxidoreductase [Thermodesulfobacteriota bacterium]